MKILYAVSEAFPFVKTGGLGDVAGSLPKILSKKGEDVRVVLPMYELIDYKWVSSMEFVKTIEIKLAWRKQSCDIYTLKNNGVTYYFLSNAYYFGRQNAYGFYDDGERFAFFSKAILDMLPAIDWFPDLIHANDWQTALVSIYLKLEYHEHERYKNIKTMFTIHNIQYQGIVDSDFIEFVAGIPRYAYDPKIFEFGDKASLMKGAIILSDTVTTVSPAYAKEIQSPEHAFGLDAVLRDCSGKLYGILNGIDDSVTPVNDSLIFKNYTADSLGGKKTNKERLRNGLKLEKDENAPVIAIITRLADHKGVDLIFSVIDDIMALGVQLVVLGKGEYHYEQEFLRCQARYPGRMSINILFSEELANRFYAAADMILIPSKSEPCGLTQMMAMRYGAVPIVRNVGGLSDTVIDCYADSENGNGFSFNDYTPAALLDAVSRAVFTFRNNKDGINKLIRRGMGADFSWNRSADKYIELYTALIK